MTIESAETGFNSARLLVTADVSTLYDQSVPIQAIELHGDNYSWTVLENVLYGVTASTVSSMTGFSTYTLSINSVTVDFKTELVDTTTAVFVINTGAALGGTGLSSYNFNVLTNAATITANLTNNSATSKTVTVNGGTPFTIAAGVTTPVTLIPKSNVAIVVT